MLLKVCGMRDKENIRNLASVRPDFMGTIFYEKSKRFIHPHDIDFPEEFVRANIQWVGVFVNELLENVISIGSDLGLDYIQLHGDEDLSYVQGLRQTGFKIVKSFPVDSDYDFEVTRAFESYCSYFLFDKKTPMYGGSGHSFDWSLLDNYKGETPFLLSGGISEESVESILRLSHDQLIGVDINSRFEKEPGLKNIDLIKKFKEKL